MICPQMDIFLFDTFEGRWYHDFFSHKKPKPMFLIGFIFGFAMQMCEKSPRKPKPPLQRHLALLSVETTKQQQNPFERRKFIQPSSRTKGQTDTVFNEQFGSKVVLDRWKFQSGKMYPDIYLVRFNIKTVSLTLGTWFSVERRLPKIEKNTT